MKEILRKVAGDKYLTIRKSYVEICGGDPACGLLLSLFEYYTKQKENFLEQVRLRNEDRKRKRKKEIELSEEEERYVWKTIEQILEDTLGFLSKPTLLKKIKKLQELGFLEVISVRKRGSVKINGYRLNTERINELLLELETGKNLNRSPVKNFTGEENDRSKILPAPVKNFTGENHQPLENQGDDGIINKNKNKNKEIYISPRANAPEAKPPGEEEGEFLGDQPKRKKDLEEKVKFWQNVTARTFAAVLKKYNTAVDWKKLMSLSRTFAKWLARDTEENDEKAVKRIGFFAAAYSKTSWGLPLILGRPEDTFKNLLNLKEKQTRKWKEIEAEARECIQIARKIYRKMEEKQNEVAGVKG